MPAAAHVLAKISRPPQPGDYAGLNRRQLILAEQSVNLAAKETGTWRHVAAHVEEIRRLREAAPK